MTDYRPDFFLGGTCVELSAFDDFSA